MTPITATWDVGSDVVSVLTNTDDSESLLYTDLVDGYERIPPNECEIQFTSKVRSSDGFSVGTVHGFLSDEDGRLSAVIVRVGVPGIRHDVLVPFSDIERVQYRRIELNIEQEEFFRLPHTGTLSEDNGQKRTLGAARERMQSEVAHRAVKVGRLSERLRTRIGNVQEGS